MEIKKYTFQTIVAPPAVRAEFTGLRDDLKTSDKTLMQAFWNLGIDAFEALKNEVANLEAMALQLRNENREMKAAAKLKSKTPEVEVVPAVEVVTKVRKKKAAAKDTSKFEVVYDASIEGDA